MRFFLCTSISHYVQLLYNFLNIVWGRKNGLDFSIKTPSDSSQHLQKGRLLDLSASGGRLFPVLSSKKYQVLRNSN